MSLDCICHETDFCVIGGGLSGLCAAVAAARHGAKVVLMQERPMLGGNASSEIRMWVSGAHGDHNRETGILEELMMENQYRNHDKNYSIWDSVLYETVRREKNITLLLNCSCMDAVMQGTRIASVKGWQMTTQQFHQVKAALFADCSGDSILAPLTGAPCRMGREARTAYGESIAPENADAHTMGLSCLLQAEETNAPHAFTPPGFARRITKEQLKYRTPDLRAVTENFWYLELGGMQNTIADTEELRDRLLALAYGMWDYLKNDPEQREQNKNWALSWVGALPGKRESRRYVGAHTLTENEVLSGGNFEDEVAYGGWTMDDHHPAGFETQERPNIFHPAPSPYGIPYGCLYSETVENLFFAGRNISVTHVAMSSTRVMATCALLGQAVGTAAAIAAMNRCLPRHVAQTHLAELQRLLQWDDCYLPHHVRLVSTLCRAAALTGSGTNVEALRDGIDRPRGENGHAWICAPGDSATYTFEQPANFARIRLVFDSDLNRESLPRLERELMRGMFHNRLLDIEPSCVPRTMLRAFRVIACFADGSQKTVVHETNNYQRLRVYDMPLVGCVSLTLEPLSTWGYRNTNVFAFEVE